MPALSKLPPQHTPAPIIQATKPALAHDILWGRPVFRAPDLPLPNPRKLFGQLPFTATRITHQVAESKTAS